MGKSKNIVDEKKHVLVALVAEKFRHSQRGESDAQACTRRLVHLAENHPDFRFRQIFLVDHACFTHFFVKVVTFTRTLAYTCKHRNTTMFYGDVVDQFLDDNRLADARATECADLATLRKWANEIDDLDSCFEDPHLCVLFG